jgi:hypothetical protein
MTQENFRIQSSTEARKHPFFIQFFNQFLKPNDTRNDTQNVMYQVLHDTDLYFSNSPPS